MPVFPGVYQAKATKVTGGTEVVIPQVFGEATITVQRFVGGPPTEVGLGWVFFQGGNPEFPVWIGVGIVTDASGSVIGPPGPQGPAGPAGATGPQGPAGATGAQGPGMTQAQADPLYVNVNGDTMTGPLVLAGAPTAPLQPTTKAYVDQLVYDVAPEANRYVTVGGQDTTFATSPGWGYFLPVRCPPCNIDALAIEVTVSAGAGGVVRLGIYSNHTTRIEPLTKFLDAGTVVSTSGGVKVLTFTPVAWPGGWMWLTAAPQVAACSLRGATGFGEPWVMFDVAQVPPALTYRSWASSAFSGVFPTTISGLGVAAQANPKIAFRTS